MLERKLTIKNFRIERYQKVLSNTFWDIHRLLHESTGLWGLLVTKVLYPQYCPFCP